MRKITFEVLVLVLVLAIVPAAQASPVKHCGNYGTTAMYPNTMHWTSDPVNFGTSNVTARGVTCHVAHSVVLHRGGRGWTCRNLHAATDYTDTRCTAPGGRAVRWEARA